MDLLLFFVLILLIGSGELVNVSSGHGTPAGQSCRLLHSILFWQYQVYFAIYIVYSTYIHCTMYICTWKVVVWRCCYWIENGQKPHHIQLTSLEKGEGQTRLLWELNQACPYMVILPNSAYTAGLGIRSSELLVFCERKSFLWEKEQRERIAHGCSFAQVTIL